MDTLYGLSNELNLDDFDVIVLHYSIYSPLNIFFHKSDAEKSS